MTILYKRVLSSMLQSYPPFPLTDCSFCHRCCRCSSLCPGSIVPDSCERILGFGRRVTWSSDLVVPPGHQMTFKDALHIMSTNLIMKIILPGWTKNLTKHNRTVEQSFVELKVSYFDLS
jgi:hypothetical protein